MDTKILSIIAETMGVPAENLTGDSSPDTVPTWDSTNHMRMVLALEEAFDIEFDEDQIIEMVTVEQILTATRAKAS